MGSADDDCLGTSSDLRLGGPHSGATLSRSAYREVTIPLRAARCEIDMMMPVSPALRVSRPAADSLQDMAPGFGLAESIIESE